MAIGGTKSRATWLVGALLVGAALPAWNTSAASTAPTRTFYESVAGCIDTPAGVVDEPLRLRTPSAIRSPVPVGKPGQEVAAAKMLMLSLRKMKGIDDLPPLLTNESAAIIGLVFGGVLYMTSAFADGMQGMTQSYASGVSRLTGAGSPSTGASLAANSDLQRLRQLKTDVDGVFRSYDVDLRSGPGTGLPPALKANGRSMLSDILDIMHKLPRKSVGHTNGYRFGSSGPSASQIGDSVANVQYRTINRTQVRITGVDRNGKRQSMIACVEDGGWRLQICDFGRLMKAGSQAQAE